MSLWASVLSLFAPAAAVKIATDAAPTPTPEPPPARPRLVLPMDPPEARAGLFDAKAGYNPFKPSARPFPPGVAMRPRMAMDETAEFGQISNWAFEGVHDILGSDREGFLGYAYLAILSQKPEYRAVVDIIAEESTRKWIKFQATGDADKSDKIAKIEAELKRLDARAVFKALCVQDGFFGRAHLYIDLGTTDDSEELKTPIGNGRDKISRAKIGKDSLERIHTVEAMWCSPQDYNTTDPLSRDWYRPKSWYCFSRQIHASRLLTFVGRPVPDLLKPAYQFGGQSMTQIMRPVVENWLRTRQGVGDIINAFSSMVFSTNLTEVMNTTGGGTTADAFKRIELFTKMRNNQGTFVIDKTAEDLKNVAAPLGTLDALQAQSQEHLASLSRVPIIKLLGIQPAGLNASSEGELTAFEDNINSFQEAFYRPNLTVVIDMIQCSLFGQPDPEITFIFEPLTSLDETELATLRKAEAETASVHLANGAISRAEERQRIAADPDTPYPGLDDKAPAIEPSAAAAAAQAAEAAIVGAFEAGLTDRPTALRALKAFGDLIGFDFQIEDELIQEAEEEPPAPPPPAPGNPFGGGDPNDPDGNGGGGEGGPPQGDVPKAGAPTSIDAAADEAAPLGIVAYHGSPYDFDTFETSSIGSGEGMKTYGFGLYFAESPIVAETYSDKLAPETIRQLYQVVIAAKPDAFLDWDKPLSAQGPLGATIKAMLPAPADPTGAMAYEALANGQDRKASEALLKAGVVGIRYLDGFSRAKGYGTSNYVIFDPSIITITQKNGVAISPEQAADSLKEMVAARDASGHFPPHEPFLTSVPVGASPSDSPLAQSVKTVIAALGFDPMSLNLDGKPDSKP